MLKDKSIANNMWPFNRNKFSKLQRSDVVNSIVELTQKEASLEDEVLSKQKEIESLLAKGKADKNPQTRLFLAKKINFLKEEIKADSQRVMYLLYNLSLLNKLKNTIDDNEFFANVSGQDLNKLLGDQKQLAIFLNKSLNRKIKSEDILTSADDIFNEVAEAYEPNEAIYDANSKDEEMLSMFEMDDISEIDNAELTSEEPKAAEMEGDK